MLLLCLLLWGGHPHELPRGLKGPKPVIEDQHQIEVSQARIDMTLSYFEKHNQPLAQGLKKRKGLEQIRMEPAVVVVHFTSIPTLEEVVAYFEPDVIASDRGKVTSAGSLNVGIQFIVDQDGTIYRSYPEEDLISRHVIGLNHCAIGIENVGNADLGQAGEGKRPLTEAQLAANVALIRYLAGKYKSLRWMIGHMEYRELENAEHPAHELFHEDIDAYRTDKIDPGPIFMRHLRDALK